MSSDTSAGGAFAYPAPPPVTPPTPPAAPTNRAPTLQGSPDPIATAGSAYGFTPTASDADGDTLTFSITGKPAWATFDSATGRLSGTPLLASIGIFASIMITVSDGRTTATLPAFTIAVEQIALGSLRLQWIPPTQNTDGSSLSNLSAYRLYHSSVSSTTLQPTVDLSNPGLTAYSYENLTPGTHYFAITAISAIGVESSFSNVLVRDIR